MTDKKPDFLTRLVSFLGLRGLIVIVAGAAFVAGNTVGIAVTMHGLGNEINKTIEDCQFMVIDGDQLKKGTGRRSQ
jgi:hypothetical protein